MSERVYYPAQPLAGPPAADPERELLEAYGRLGSAANRDGRLIMADLQQHFAGDNPFVAGMPDQTAHNCGCLRVLQHIQGRIDTALERYPPRPMETSHE